MKKNLLYFLLMAFFVASAILYSCHKDAAVVNQQQATVPPLDLATAQKYYVNLKKNQGDFVTETAAASSSVGKPN